MATATSIKTTGAERQAAREAAKAEWVAKAYAGLPYPTGPNNPLPRRRALEANPHRLGSPNPMNKRVRVVWSDGQRERRYHFTKGYRWGRA
jgi:hypothetical protein